MKGLMQFACNYCENRNREKHRNSAVTRNEEFWLEVIREASSDSDLPPNLDQVRRIRAIFRRLPTDPEP